MSPEVIQKIAVWRQKAAAGTLTEDEMREAIKQLRAGREAASAASAVAKRKTATKVIPKADDLLDELEGL